MKTLSKILIILFILLSEINMHSQWVYEFSPYRQAVHYLNVVDTSIIWGIGDNSSGDAVIVRKLGSVWDWYDYTNLPSGNQLYSSIAGIDSNIAFVGSLTGKVYKTSDRGYDWTQILDAGNRWVFIKFSKINKSTGYIFCSNQFTTENFIIYKTTNYGNTWQTFTPNFGNYSAANKPSVWVTDSAHAWVALGCNSLQNCAGPKIAYTTNGGINWLTTSFVDGNRTGVSTLAFKSDNQFGMAVTYWFSQPINIWITTNGGSNWAFSRSFPIPINPTIINVPGTSVWYLGGTNPNTPSRAFIYKSSDDGASWFQMSTDDSTYDGFWDMDGIALNNKIHAWSIVWGGENYYNYMKILRLIDTVSVIGINNHGSNIPKEFRIEQNYPNPFNPTTKIRYALPKASIVKIVIYNVMGQVLKELVNEYKNAGNYDVAFDGTNLPSGIFFYRIETPYFSDSKKMVLIK